MSPSHGPIYSWCLLSMNSDENSSLSKTDILPIDEETDTTDNEVEIPSHHGPIGFNDLTAEYTNQTLPCQPFYIYRDLKTQLDQKRDELDAIMKEGGVVDSDGLLRRVETTDFICPHSNANKGPAKMRISSEEIDWQHLFLTTAFFVGGTIVLYRLTQKQCLRSN